MRLIPGPPSPAMLVALLALFVSLGGVGYAATKGSIGSRAIADGSIRSSDVRNNSLSSTDVRNGTLTGTDLKSGSVKGDDLAADSLGPKQIDEATLTVPKAVVAESLSGVRTVVAESGNVPALAAGVRITAKCGASEQAIGGGAGWVNPGSTAGDLLRSPTISASAPVPSQAGSDHLTGWYAQGTNDPRGVPMRLRAYAICLERQP